MTLVDGQIDVECKELQKATTTLAKSKYLFYLQCVKHKCFKEIDKNMTLFHSMIKWNNKRREIEAIEKSNGEIIIEFLDVVIALFKNELIL